jgi:nucleoside-diphosphate-sugar epimerase
MGWAMEKVADNVTHKPPQLTYKTARYGTRKLWFDCNKARAELHLPRTPFRDTIEKSIRWFRANGYAN